MSIAIRKSRPSVSTPSKSKPVKSLSKAAELMSINNLNFALPQETEDNVSEEPINENPSDDLNNLISAIGRN